MLADTRTACVGCLHTLADRASISGPSSRHPERQQRKQKTSQTMSETRTVTFTTSIALKSPSGCNCRRHRNDVTNVHESYLALAIARSTLSFRHWEKSSVTHRVSVSAQPIMFEGGDRDRSAETRPLLCRRRLLIACQHTKLLRLPTLIGVNHEP
eukprot:1366005-Rhodomonas_salina.5